MPGRRPAVLNPVKWLLHARVGCRTTTTPDVIEKLTVMSPVLDTVSRSVLVMISLDTY